MVDLAAVSAIGERIVDLLRQRQRADLAARALAPLTVAFDIRQLATGMLAEAPEGLSVTCVQIAVGAEHRQAPTGLDGRRATPSTALTLSYLIAAHAADPVHEQAMLSWAMLVLAAYPILKEAPGDPAIPLTLQPTDCAELARLCAALGSPLRLAFVAAARDVVLENPPAPEGPPPVMLGRRG